MYQNKQYSYNKSRSLGEMIGECLHNIFSSGFLLIAGLLLMFSSLVSIVSCLLPFWFKLTLYNQIFGDELYANDTEIDTGLYFMDKDRFINLLMIDKASSVQLMPDYLKFAQLLYLIGTIGILVCTASALLLLTRDKVVVSAEMALAGATVAIALCQVLGVILCVIQVLVNDQAMWQDLPVKDAIPNRFGYYKVLEAYPKIELNWGFYFAAAAALFSLVSAICVVLQMFLSCNRLSHIRYQMLREKPDEGTSPIPGYPYYANKGYDRQPGGYYGLPPPEERPLMYTVHPYQMPSATEVDL